MATHHHQSKAAVAVKAVATLGSSPFFPPVVRATDPYDNRLEAQEKELNVMEDDSKGKNVATTPGEVPAFAHATRKDVQRLATFVTLGSLLNRVPCEQPSFSQPLRN